MFASLYGFPEHRRVRNRLPLVRGLLGELPPVILDRVPRSAVDFDKKRSGRLLFLKNGNDPDALIRSWQESLPSDAFVMLADLSGELANKLDSDEVNDIDTLI